MGKTDPQAERHKQQSMILVPRDTPGVTLVRPLTVFGYDDAPHGHFGDRVRRTCACRASNLLLGEGRGFEIAQGRLGPRPDPSLHARDRRRRTLARGACARGRKSRVAFGKPIAEQGVVMEAIARSRMEIEQARLLTLKAAHMMDTVGQQGGPAPRSP